MVKLEHRSQLLAIISSQPLTPRTLSSS